MENYKLATKQRLRFTFKGQLTTEQLWDLSLEDLDALAVSLQAELDESSKKTFLKKTSSKDKTAKLKFDVVLDVLDTKAEEAQLATEAAENKKHNEKILALIAEKQDDSLKGKTVEELEALLK